MELAGVHATDVALVETLQCAPASAQTRSTSLHDVLMAMSQHGVRVGQNVILEVLWIGDGQTPGELASALGIATPTVVRTAERRSSAARPRARRAQRR
jgi:hypothetical protein